MKKVFDFIEFKVYKTKWIILSSILFAAILFRPKLESWVSLKIVTPYLSHIRSNIIHDILFLSIIICTLVIGLNRLRRGYLVGSFNFAVYLALLSSFVYYRALKFPWSFHRFYSLDIYYLDALFFPFLVGVTLFLVNICSIHKFVAFLSRKLSNKKGSKHFTPFILDEALKAHEDDLLNRRSDAEELVNRMLVTNSDRSIVIGINGEWGSGKSSFTQMMKDKLNNDRRAVILDFNPWRGYRQSALYNDFFICLSEAVGKQSDLLRVDLKKYSDTLASSKDNFLESIVSVGTNLFIPDSLEEQHEEINRALRKIDRSFIVFIDDLDRLASNEIADIVKLVRNTADFYNLKFVLAYDRGYLLSALKTINEYNFTAYLEKIILYEHSLSPVGSTAIEAAILKILSENIIPSALPTIDKIKPVFSRTTHVKHFLVNLRDVKRFANNFLSTYNKRHEEIDLTDYINYSILQLRYPTLLRRLYFSRESFFIETDNGVSTLTAVNGKPEQLILFNYIEENSSTLQIDLADKQKLFELLRTLFVVSPVHSKVPIKSIKRINNINAYFRETDSEIDLSYRDFRILLNKSLSEVNTEMTELVNGGKRRALVEKFTHFNTTEDCNSKEDFEKVITSMFYLGNIPSGSKKEYHEFPSRELFNKLYYQKSIANKFYDGQIVDYKNFLLRTLDSAKFPYYNESEFLSFLSGTFSSDFILGQTEVEKYLLYYFQKYCNERQEFEQLFWALFHNCIEKVTGPSGSLENKILDGARKIQIEFVFKNSKILKGYLQSITNIDRRSDDKQYSVSGIVDTVFGSIEKFVLELKKSKYKELDFVQEFVVFEDALRSSGNSYIPFVFAKLQIN
ncbi:hypothetical protein CNR22_19610 [Sphingobacteriaceae bacterium]|nr:hypothetical protein CNR22_19610 [Sphingobacteriaceae bacterium]